MPRSAQHDIESFLRVGVTGGIGSGKSTVCKLFTKLGLSVLYADEIARFISETNDEVKASIKRTFGGDVMLQNGKPDRNALRKIIFQNQSLRKELDAIIHPHVFVAIEDEINKLSASKRSPYVIVEAALIYESGMDKHLDYVLVVNADEETRIKRVMDRDKINRSDVLARIQSQMDVEKKKELADFVIENDGNQDELFRRVKFLHNVLSAIRA